MEDSEHLQQFFGAYFHQDYRDEAPDWQRVVALFAGQATPAYVARTVADLEELLRAGRTESELNAVLERLGCCYTPRPDLGGPTYSEWLEQVVTELKQYLR